MNDIASWTSVLQGVLILMIGWLARMVGLVLREVRAINGRITRLEEWREGRKEWGISVEGRLSGIEDRERKG